MTAPRDKWDARLDNWALWVVSDYGTSDSGVISGIYAPEQFRRAGYRSKPPPPINGDAMDVDGLLVKLDEEGDVGHELYMAIRARYVWSGPFDVRAQSLGIHPDTFRNRVKAAKERLEDLDQERRRRLTKPPRVA